MDLYSFITASISATIPTFIKAGGLPLPPANWQENGWDYVASLFQHGVYAYNTSSATYRLNIVIIVLLTALILVAAGAVAGFSCGREGRVRCPSLRTRYGRGRYQSGKCQYEESSDDEACRYDDDYL